MKLSNIKYGSAVYFGAIALVMYLFLGVVQWNLRSVLATQGVIVSAKNVFLITPVVGAVIGLLSIVIMIFVYNYVAQKFPIAWEVKK